MLTFDRALQRTMIRNLRQALRLAEVDVPKSLPPNASKLDDDAVQRIATLFKLNPQRPWSAPHTKRDSSNPPGGLWIVG